MRQFQFCSCDLEDRGWDTTYGTFSPVDIPASPFWAVDAIIKQAVREEIGRQNSGGEREETLPGGITTSAPSQRSTISRLSSLLDHIRGKKKGKKTNDGKEHQSKLSRFITAKCHRPLFQFVRRMVEETDIFLTMLFKLPQLLFSVPHRKHRPFLIIQDMTAFFSRLTNCYVYCGASNIVALHFCPSHLRA